MQNRYLPLAARKRRHAGGGGGGTPPSAFSFRKAFIQNNIFNSGGGFVEFRGGVGPYTCDTTIGSGVTAGVPQADPIFSWVGHGSAATPVITATFSDSLGASFVIVIDYTPILGASDSRPVYPNTPPGPPVVSGPAVLTVNGDAIDYDWAFWSGTHPLTVTQRLFVDGVDTDGFRLSYPMQESWRGKPIQIRETATNADGGPVEALSNIVTGPAAPLAPPVSTANPDLDLSPDENTLLYTPGTWTGNPTPTITARLFVQGVDTAAAAPSMPVDPAWRGKECGIREEANNAAGGPVYALSAEVLVPDLPPADPEADLIAFLNGRVAYGLDATDRSTMFQDDLGTVPVTADGQAVGRIVTKFKPATPVVQDFANGTQASKPLAGPGYVAGDGIDDFLNYNQGGTGVFPIFQGLDGFVASICITPIVPLGTEAYFTAGFGGTLANFRLRIQGLADGRAQFSCQEQQNGAPVSATTAAAVFVAGTPVVLTMAVDHDAKVMKGYANGVEVVSLNLPLTISPFNYDINRLRLMQLHGNTVSAPSNAQIHRMLFLHDKADLAGIAKIEAWVGEFA